MKYLGNWNEIYFILLPGYFILLSGYFILFPALFHNLLFHSFPGLFHFISSLELYHNYFIFMLSCLGFLWNEMQFFIFCPDLVHFLPCLFHFNVSYAKFHNCPVVTNHGKFLLKKVTNCRASFKDFKYTKIILIAAFLKEKNAKYLTKPESFEIY